MSLFLSPYSGRGTKEDPFAPRGLDTPGASAIDIRLDPTVVNGSGIGFALLWMPLGETDPAGAIKLADDYGELLTTAQRAQLNARLGLDFDRDTTIQDLVETILLRPDTGRWKQLRPTKGRLEVWLGSGSGRRRWVDLPVLAGGSITDNFDRANETPLASPWVKSTGWTDNINLSSNAIVGAGTSGGAWAYTAPGGWSADQSSKITYASTITSNDFATAVRLGSDGKSGYRWEMWTGGPKLMKTVNGTVTELVTSLGAPSVGNTYKIDVVGSTIRFYENDSERAESPVVDTSLTTAGDGPGVITYTTSGSLDNWIGTGEFGTVTAWLTA